jgi:hypothetical protein
LSYHIDLSDFYLISKSAASYTFVE